VLEAWRPDTGLAGPDRRPSSTAATEGAGRNDDASDAAGIDCRDGTPEFISRHHLQGWQRGGARLKEIPQKDATMRRRLVVTYRERSYGSPAAQRLIARLARSTTGERS
jgi:DNA-binding transcriptional LysR family regulator